jgi:hypothetical protein
MVNRKTELRTSKYVHNYESFDYPFSQMYPLNEINTKILGLPLLKPGKFPKNIKEWLWSFPGENDFNPWYLLCRLKNNNYALYIAWCDYTGFDCRGGMKLYIAKDLENIINYAMSNYVYKLYIKNTIKYNENYVPKKNNPKFIDTNNYLEIMI